MVLCSYVVYLDAGSESLCSHVVYFQMQDLVLCVLMVAVVIQAAVVAEGPDEIGKIY